MRKNCWISFVLSLVLIFSLASCGLFKDNFKIYTYDDIRLYGTEYPISRYEDYDISEHLAPIFPEKIEPFFEVQSYSYKMCHEPAMHEAYLEIKIDDEATYQAYVATLVGGKAITPFLYDSTFDEWVLSNTVTTQHEGTTIGHTVIQKILFSGETNTIIFVSVYVPHNDMPLRITNFSYFNRFGIVALENTR